jgi:hypothetical protein
MGTLEGARKYADLINLIATFFHFAKKKREFHVLLDCVSRMKQPALCDWFIMNSAKFD